MELIIDRNKKSREVSTRGNSRLSWFAIREYTAKLPPGLNDLGIRQIHRTNGKRK